MCLQLYVKILAFWRFFPIYLILYKTPLLVATKSTNQKWTRRIEFKSLQAEFYSFFWLFFSYLNVCHWNYISEFVNLHPSKWENYVQSIHFKIKTCGLMFVYRTAHWHSGRVFCNGPVDQDSIPSWIKPKTLKMVLDSHLLNTQH